MSDELPPTDVEIREYRPGDETEILRAFHKVFPWANRSLEEWNWEFRDCPRGIHCFLGVLGNGQVVSQFTGIPRLMKVGNETREFAEIVDSLSDPDFRQGLKKPGLFATTVYRYVDHFGRPDRETVMYGLPNPPAFRIGSRLLGYSPFYQMESLGKDVGGDAALPSVRPLDGGRLDEIDEFPDDTDALWRRVSAEYDIAVIRDRRYLTWRYLRKPKTTYRKFALRDGLGALVGIFVLKDQWLPQELGRQVTVVVEWVVDRRHPLTKMIPEVVPHLGRSKGADEVRFVFRPGSDEWMHCAEVGYDPRPTPFRFVGRTYDAAVVPLDRLAKNWFITLGDFDVV